MKWFLLVSALVLAAQLAGQEKSNATLPVIQGSEDVRQPVLRMAEPADSLVVTLPGAPRVARASVPPVTPLPAPFPVEIEQDADDHRPLLRRAPKPVLPAEFERDAALFCQKLIGSWAESDAYNLFGDSLRERPVFDEDGAESGRIVAYSDPTGRYREIELDFAKSSGTLRTVFVYPWQLTWRECRKLWGANVESTEANKGRIFYSYVNRRLDVLVDESGKVISLGLY